MLKFKEYLFGSLNYSGYLPDNHDDDKSIISYDSDDSVHDDNKPTENPNNTPKKLTKIPSENTKTTFEKFQKAVKEKKWKIAEASASALALTFGGIATGYVVKAIKGAHKSIANVDKLAATNGYDKYQAFIKEYQDLINSPHHLYFLQNDAFKDLVTNDKLKDLFTSLSSGNTSIIKLTSNSDFLKLIENENFITLLADKNSLDLLLKNSELFTKNFDSIQKILKNDSLMQLMQSPDVSQLLNNINLLDPKIQKLLNDQQILDLIKGGKLNELYQNEAIQNLLSNSTLKDLLANQDIVNILKNEDIIKLLNNPEIMNALKNQEFVNMLQANGFSEMISQNGIKDILANENLQGYLDVMNKTEVKDLDIIIGTASAAGACILFLIIIKMINNKEYAKIPDKNLIVRIDNLVENNQVLMENINNLEQENKSLKKDNEESAKDIKALWGQVDELKSKLNGDEYKLNEYESNTNGYPESTNTLRDLTEMSAKIPGTEIKEEKINQITGSVEGGPSEEQKVNAENPHNYSTNKRTDTERKSLNLNGERFDKLKLPKSQSPLNSNISNNEDKTTYSQIQPFSLIKNSQKAYIPTVIKLQMPEGNSIKTASNTTEQELKNKLNNLKGDNLQNLLKKDQQNLSTQNKTYTTNNNPFIFNEYGSLNVKETAKNINNTPPPLPTTPPPYDPNNKKSDNTPPTNLKQTSQTLVIDPTKTIPDPNSKKPT